MPSITTNSGTLATFLATYRQRLQILGTTDPPLMILFVLWETPFVTRSVAPRSSSSSSIRTLPRTSVHFRHRGRCSSTISIHLCLCPTYLSPSRASRMRPTMLTVLTKAEFPLNATHAMHARKYATNVTNIVNQQNYTKWIAINNIIIKKTNAQRFNIN